MAIDSTQLEHDVVDKTYMAQLIEIQHKRGAQGGQNFNKMLSSAAALVTQGWFGNYWAKVNTNRNLPDRVKSS